MDLKLNNNQHLTVSAFPDSIKAKITTVYIKDCREITKNAFSFLNSIMSLLKSITPKLSRIRVDIGACSGSYSDLMKFSNLYGFDDDYNYQKKPRFVGSYRINTWHTVELLNNARNIFGSADFTISNDSTKMINFNDLAVQVLDPNEDNYNPAVAIILQGQNIGTTMTDAPLGHGRWFLTKTQAAAVTNINKWFANKTTVTDTSNLVSSDSTQTYDFESFDELKYFTNVTGFSNNAFENCSKLKYFNFPPNIEWIGDKAMFGCFLVEFNKIPDTITHIGDRAFQNCRKITISSVPSTFTTVFTWFPDCYSISQFDFTTITGTSYQSFINCTGLLEVNLPDTFTTIGAGSFVGCTSINFFRIPPLITNIPDGSIQTSTEGIIHCTPETPPTIAQWNTFRGAKKIYVGDGSSATHDDAILADYLADSSWNTYYSSKLDTWYNYLHPTT